MTTETINVEGMSCAHCEAAVEGELDRLPGVERANADFEKGVVEVSYGESGVDAGQLEAAIERAGYTVAAR